MKADETRPSSKDADPPFSPHLGQLGLLPGEVRNSIYEYVLPPEDDRAFRSKRRFLPGKPPALLFASKQIRQETIMFYFARTTWRMLMKHNSARDRTGQDGYFLASREPGATSLGYFSYHDAYTPLELNEDTPLFQQVSLERTSGDWPSLVLKIVKERPIVSHDDCLACRAKKHRSKYEEYQYRRATRPHDESVAAVKQALFGGLVIDRLGFSVRDIREITGRITRDVSKALREQADQIRSLNRLR